jgi:DNA-binding FadR family transcriptional regulator
MKLVRKRLADTSKGKDIPGFKPVRQSRVSDEVTGQLKQSILLGQFKAGDRLPAERDLSEQFRVSRVAIREALRALQNTGFIETRQGSAGGAFVTDLTFEHLIDTFVDLFLAGKLSIPEMYRVRVLVEPEVARLATQNVTPEYARRLKDCLEGEKLSANGLIEDMEHKMALHLVLAEMCGNRFLEAIVRSAMGLTRRLLEAVSIDPKHPVGMHVPVVEAVLRKDPEAAAEAMRKHAVEFGKRLLRVEKAYRKKLALTQFLQ